MIKMYFIVKDIVMDEDIDYEEVQLKRLGAVGIKRKVSKTNGKTSATLEFKSLEKYKYALLSYGAKIVEEK